MAPAPARSARGAGAPGPLGGRGAGVAPPKGEGGVAHASLEAPLVWLKPATFAWGAGPVGPPQPLGPEGGRRGGRSPPPVPAAPPARGGPEPGGLRRGLRPPTPLGAAPPEGGGAAGGCRPEGRPPGAAPDGHDRRLVYRHAWRMIYLLIIGCTLIVLRSKNPVHSLFSLILVFLNTAILLIQSGIEYIGIFIIIVYIGAIAILFLFVIMMLNMKLLLKFENTLRYLPMVFFIALLFYQYILWQLGPALCAVDFPPASLGSKDWLGHFTQSVNIPIIDFFDLLYQLQSILVLGKVLYTYQFIYFILCGIVLLLGLYGAIILTFTPTSSIHLQNIYLQNSRLLNNNTFHYEPFSS